jgi:hypothetical protein
MYAGEPSECDSVNHSRWLVPKAEISAGWCTLKRNVELSFKTSKPSSIFAGMIAMIQEPIEQKCAVDLSLVVRHGHWLSSGIKRSNVMCHHFPGRFPDLFYS